MNLHDELRTEKDKMILNKFIFLHFPRTGGTTLRRMLPQIPGGHQELSWAHAPLDFYVGVCKLLNIPAPPSFVFVRNPWTWYVSQWKWQVRTDPTCPDTFRVWMEMIKVNTDAGLHNINYTVVANITCLSHIWEYMQGDGADYVGRFEDLENEVVRILGSIMPEVDGQWVKDRFASAGHRNKTSIPPHYASYRELYDRDIEDWVMSWDGGYMDKFDYGRLR